MVARFLLSFFPMRGGSVAGVLKILDLIRECFDSLVAISAFIFVALAFLLRFRRERFAQFVRVINSGLTICLGCVQFLLKRGLLLLLVSQGMF